MHVKHGQELLKQLPLRRRKSELSKVNPFCLVELLHEHQVFKCWTQIKRMLDSLGSTVPVCWNVSNHLPVLNPDLITQLIEGVKDSGAMGNLHAQLLQLKKYDSQLLNRKLT